jgi:hypothetical protein
MANLLDLLHELAGRNIPVMIGGGFGLFLKRKHLNAIGAHMLLETLPESRATNDLDLFLRAELLADLRRTRQVREAILRLGYTPVEEAKFMHWKRPIVVGGVPQEIKLDFLVGPLGRFRSRLKVSMPRVRPKGNIEFHAHAVEEAISLEDQPFVVQLDGLRSSGERFRGSVEVPDAFPYLMMKLHALADRKDDENKDLGRDHALDVYTIVGMMTEPEYDRARRIGREQIDNENVCRGRSIVREDFASSSSMGVLRIREHQLYRDDFQIDAFLDVLREMFPGR